MRAVDEITFDIGGRQLAAKRWRGGGRPTMALHGWLDNANSFDGLAQALPELDMLALDFAGHGRSDPRAADVGYWGWLDIQDTLAVANQLGWSRFTIIGHSMGAEYSTQLVALYPERVDVQVCIDGWVEATSMDTVLREVRENLDTCLIESTSTPRVYDSLEDMAERLAGARGMDYSAASNMVKRGHRAVEGGFVWATEPKIRATHTQRQPDEVVLALAARTLAPTLLLRGSDGEHWFDHSVELVRGVVPVLEERILVGPHHLHLSDALPDVVEEIRFFLERYPT